MRALVMDQMVSWFTLDQALWVIEPRSLAMTKPGESGFMYVRQMPGPELFEPMMTFRAENRFLQQMIAQPDAGPILAQDLCSRKSWSQNVFQHEVCVNMGLSHMMAVEISEGPESSAAIFAPVLGRERRAFKQDESQWLARVHWALKPVLTHLRQTAKRTHWAHVHRSSMAGILTPREQEVFYWMGQGKRNREIAQILGCAPRTVEKHVERILQKTQAETRTAATLSNFF